jgi:hypothetical protein
MRELGDYTSPTLKEADEAIKLLAKHQHQFTIPVEFEEWTALDKEFNEVVYKKVTKLRCPCGKEIER